MLTLQNKRAVITGGSDGIGLAIAKAFVASDADVIIIARNEEKLVAAQSQLLMMGAREVYCISANLSDYAVLSEIAEQITEIWPEIDILVNNAGTASFSAFEEVTLDELEGMINLNIKAPYHLSQSLIPILEKRQGNIINISSYFSQRMIPGRNSTAYSLTKGALDSFTKALASEMGSRGIRVNAIAPGTVDTQLVRTALENMTTEAANNFQEMIKTIYPMGRIGKPEDVSGMAVYLSSDLAKWVTGAIFNVDGGLTTN